MRSNTCWLTIMILIAGSGVACTQPLSFTADCEAPNRWSWGWTLTIDDTGAGSVELKPDAYGEAAFEDLRLTSEQLASFRAALKKARFFELEPEYGSAGGAVRRTLQVKQGQRSHKVSFTSTHTELDAVPTSVLELWCTVRELFDTYRAHDGSDYIHQYLRDRAAAGS